TQRHQQEGRGKQCRTVNANDALEEIERVLHLGDTFLPCLFQCLHLDTTDRVKARLSGGKSNWVLQVQTEIQFEAVSLRTLILKALESFKRATPLSSDLGQGGLD